jgi:hypothetical protein
MWRMIWVITILLLGFVSSVSAESLYLTSSRPGPNVGFGSNSSFTFVAPYVTRVETRLSISITKVAGNAGATAKAVSPTVLKARWQAAGGGQIVYSVSCDLSSVLVPGQDLISVMSALPATPFTGQKEVIDVKPSYVTVKGPDTKPDDYKSGGTISDVTCPPPGADTFAVTLAVNAVPRSRGYLYLLGNAFFNDSVNVSVGIDGMLTNSTTSSVQQITAIITELAQTAGTVAGDPGLFTAKTLGEKTPPAPDPRQKCNSAIANFVKSAPFYKTYTPSFISMRSPADTPVVVASDPSLGDTVLHFSIKPLVGSGGQARIGEASHGLVAFFPIPASAEITCTFGKEYPVLLSPPSVVSLYTESRLLDPQRDFLTNPQDTFTFNAGIITGHQHTSQSSAKTIVDTVTAPIRALIPSVSVQQTTQVLTGGGKPDQTTTTTQTTTGAPKSP